MSFILPGRSAGSSSSNLYSWWSGFDKSLFPPQLSSGVWGASSPIQEVSAPVITSTGTASTPAQFQDACYTGGVRLTLSADLADFVVTDSDILDTEIVIPDGAQLVRVGFGQYVDPPTPFPTTIQRLRIRGATSGVHGTGLSHKLSFSISPSSTDIILDGHNGSGPGGNNGWLTIAGSVGGPPTRLAIDNMAVNCGGYGVISDMSHATITRTSMMTGQDLVDPRESWGYRAAHSTLGNVVGYWNDFRKNASRVNNAHHLWRVHPDPGLLYTWIAYNIIINRPEGRVSWFDAPAGTGTGLQRAGWVVNNLIITQNTSGGSPGGIDGPSQEYMYVLGNTIQSSLITSAADILASGTVLTDKTSTPNTYSSAPGSDPAWLSGTPGDPTSIPWNI